MKTGSNKVDHLGRAYAGSQLQFQIYVNRRHHEFNEAIAVAFHDFESDTRIDWVSPLEADQFEEYRDREFLMALDLDHLSPDFAEFWPRGGPVWDALAEVNPSSGRTTGVLLVEGKSYPSEMRSHGTRAGAKSLKMIEASLARTRTWLAATHTASWTDDLYQFANRLAHLDFFRKVVGIPAWLASLNFIDDPHHPTSLHEWQNAMPATKADLDIGNADIPFYSDVYIPARPRTELAPEERESDLTESYLDQLNDHY